MCPCPASCRRNARWSRPHWWMLAAILATACPSPWNVRAAERADAGSGAHAHAPATPAPKLADVFSPRGSFLVSPTEASFADGGRGPSLLKAAGREDEFHPRRSYSQQLLAMIQRNANVSDAVPDGGAGCRRHASVGDLATTLLADPMSLFRRRKRAVRSASARAAALFSPAEPPANASLRADADNASAALASARNASFDGAVGGAGNASDALAAEQAEDLVGGGGTTAGGIPRLTLTQREALVKRWGADFEQLEEEAFALFCRLHSAGSPPVGCLTPAGSP